MGISYPGSDRTLAKRDQKIQEVNYYKWDRELQPISYLLQQSNHWENMGILTSVLEFKSISTLPALRGRRLGLLLFHFTEQKCIVISDFQLIQLPKLFLSNCNLSNKSASIHVLRLLCACSSENNLPAAVVLGLLLFQNSAQAGSMSVH